jgi:hypothetical protein
VLLIEHDAPHSKFSEVVLSFIVSFYDITIEEIILSGKEFEVKENGTGSTYFGFS